MSGKRVSGSSHKKTAALIVSLALVLTAVLGVTIAYLTAQTPGVTNTFTPGQVSCEVVEEFKDNVKSSVKVKNTSDTDVYIRVAVVANYVDEKGNLLAGDPGITFTPGSDWVKHTDGYYYYTKTVSPDKTDDKDLTGNLLGANGLTLPESTQVTILAEAIQATGTVNNQTTTEYAWGVTISGNSVTKYTGGAK